jgi:hypothetical protein
MVEKRVVEWFAEAAKLTGNETPPAIPAPVIPFSLNWALHA